MGYTTVFGIIFIFLMTTLGASFVYLFKGEISPAIHATMLAFASGVMVAASVWSLLIPAMEQSAHWGKLAFLPAAVGVLAGGGLILWLDRISERVYGRGLTRNARLFLAVTMHNVPEGLAVGFAFGAGGEWSALGLAFGIGVQNIPEGAAISLPLRASGMSRNKAFFKGAFSGVFEPAFAVLGYFLAKILVAMQPWLLALSAGTMLCVVAGDLLPEACAAENRTRASVGFLLGFALMMLLDVALG